MNLFCIAVRGRGGEGTSSADSPHRRLPHPSPPHGLATLLAQPMRLHKLQTFSVLIKFCSHFLIFPDVFPDLVNIFVIL
jgi:hypothetical protein